jgi:hypothetical protein
MTLRDRRAALADAQTVRLFKLGCQHTLTRAEAIEWSKLRALAIRTNRLRRTGDRVAR